MVKVADVVKDVESLANTSFPYEVFPNDVQKIILETNKHLQFPIDFICSGLLYATSLAIGNTHRIRVKKDWEETCVLYLINVGRPGANKSAPMSFALEPILKRDSRYFEQYEAEEKEYRTQMQKFKRGEIGDEPQKPNLKKFIVSDCTPEAVTHVHYHNKRGIGIYVDEIAGFIKNFNRYNTSGEQEFYLSNWSGKPIIIDRKISTSVRVDKPFISIIGTIQTGILDELAKDNRSKNGFMDRLLFLKPKNLRRPEWTDGDIGHDIKLDWQNIIDRLIDIDFESESTYLSYSPEAWRKIKEWQVNSLSNDELFESEQRDSISAKIETYVHRFALIIQMLRWACSIDGKSSVSPESADSAIAIAEYFKSQAIDIHEYLNNKNPIHKLPENKQKIYLKLPFEFSTAIGLSIADELGIKRSAFMEWLKDGSFFIRERQGLYKKVYK